MQVARFKPLKRGELLSNTLSIYPQDRDNLGKLRLIPDRRHGLEWCVFQKDQWHAHWHRLRMRLRLIR